jgi:apolipoprotein N-acyltransferase
MATPSVKASSPAHGALAARTARASWMNPVLGALLLWLAFPPVRLPAGVFVGWLPLLHLVEETRSGRLAPGALRRRLWLAGFLFFAGLLYWILALSNEQVTIPGLMIPSLLLVGAYLGLFFVLTGEVLRRLGSWGRLPLGLLFPLVWTAVEWLRSLGPLGFPWGAPGYALARVPTALQFTAWTGFWGTTLWIGAVTGLLHEALARRHHRLRLLGAALLVLVLPLLVGTLRLRGAPPPREALAGRGGLRVGIVQPNVVREIKWRPGGAEASWERLQRQSLEALGEGAEILVWPETALPLRLLEQPVYLLRVRRLLREHGVPLVTGTLSTREDAAAGRILSFNSAILLSPEGDLLGIYHKRRLVPFSERMPLQRLLPFMTQIDFGQSDFTPGREGVLLSWKGLRMAPLICYESIFPDLSAAYARSGATALVNVTNDFWFGRTPGPVQHAEMAIVRAVETGLPLLRCANTGLSFFVDPYGRVVSGLGLFREGHLVEEVGPGRPTFAVRHPGWFLRLVWAGLLGCFAWAWIRRRGRREA